MESRCSSEKTETASVSINWTWMVCVLISSMLFYWKSSILRKFRALLGCLRPPQPQTPDLNWPLPNLHTVSERTTDFNSGTGSPLPLDLEDSPSAGYLRSKSNRRVYKYDVFLSFRGADTRNTFTDHLYNHLVRKGIFAFKDDKRLEIGQSIAPQLLQAIRDSRISIVVFSSDYAGSRWCLEEMDYIHNCHKSRGQTVFPIFYDVDPSHVRKQRGPYKNAFLLQTQKFKLDPLMVRRWKMAMTSLANLAGWDLRDKPEYREIEKIVQKVIKSLGHKFSGFADDLIGIQFRVKQLEIILHNCQVLGIWGMSGIGKTTHATALYDRISYQFDACCFVEDVSKTYRDGGAIAVQKQILRHALYQKNVDTYSSPEISRMIAMRLQNIKVLVVLDNVDELEQLHGLAISCKSLHPESRVIITTSDKHILKVYGADIIHEVQELNNNDARELFYNNAFRSDDSSSEFGEMIPEVLQYAQGLPLAIKVMGSFLCTRDATQWRATLDGLKNNPDKKITDILKMSIDGLEPEYRDIFLHIACFFKGEREDYVTRILDCCGLNPRIGIPVITEKSLITIKNQEIHMHEILQQVGRKIAQEQFPEEPGLWSRLWRYQDFRHVITTETGTNNVKAIVLDQKEHVSEFSSLRAEELSKLRGLRLLMLHHKNFSGIPDFLSNRLHYFLWHGYPFPSLPLNFQPDRLVELNIPDSSIERLWEGIKPFPSLKRMDLSNSKYLMVTPNFKGTPNLQRLDLTGCTELSEVDRSIGHLRQLAFLSLQNCSKLVDLRSVSNISSLIVLNLSGCTMLEHTPDFSGLSKLEYLNLERCIGLSTVHRSIGDLANLKFLSLGYCTSLKSIPHSINFLKSLQTLDLHNCINFMNLPLEKTPMCRELLIFLDLSFCNLSEVPDAIGELRCLERLNLEGNNFVSLPDSFSGLSSLAYLNLSNCQMLKYLPKLPFASAPSVGSYFRTVSQSRNHRSGLYVLNCANLKSNSTALGNYYCANLEVALEWLIRLIKEPRHFRCGFDIVIPVSTERIPACFNIITPQEGQLNSLRLHSFVGMDDQWIGFVFGVSFEASNVSEFSGSSSSLPPPHPLYLCFENEHVEEYFHMPLRLDHDTNLSSPYIWLIYISRPHCHFVKTGARITVKARSGLEIKRWGCRSVSNQNMEVNRLTEEQHSSLQNMRCSSSSRSSISEPRIQLPYNWFITEAEENEKMEAEEKENNLSNVGF